jgi:putative transposase
MSITTTKLDSSQLASETAVYLFDDWFDPIEAGVRDRVREFIQAMVEGELGSALMRPRYGRRPKSLSDAPAAGVTGHRHGHRPRSLTGTFGRIEIEVPRARLDGPDGKRTEWKSKTLRAYQRRTLAADALIASCYLAGINTRRVRRALKALFGGAVNKDTVSRVRRKVKGDWDAWNTRSLAEEPIVRLILDGTVVRVRLDRKATSISLLVVIGVREDGQKILLAVKNMGGETTEAWRAVLDDLIKRGLRRSQFLIMDGAAGLERAIAAVWDGIPVQRCTVGSLKKWSVPLVYAAMRPVAPASSPARGCDLGNGLPGRDPAQQKRKESGCQPLEVDCSGGQINLDLHIGEATPDGAREPMPRLGFAMKAL